MNVKNLKKTLNNKVHPAWGWAVVAVAAIISLIIYSYSAEPKWMPQPIKDISNKIVGGILGDKGERDSSSDSKDNSSGSVSKSSPSSNVSDWQTYENKDLGFSIKYPKDWMNSVTREDAVSFYDKKYEGYEVEFPFIKVTLVNKSVSDINTWVDDNKKMFIGDMSSEEAPNFTKRSKCLIGGFEATCFLLPTMGEQQFAVANIKEGIVIVEAYVTDSFKGSSEFNDVYHNFLKSFKKN